MKKSNVMVLALSVVILGLLAGLAAGLLSVFMDTVGFLFLGFEESAFQPVPLKSPPLQRLISVVMGGCLAALSWWLIRRKTKIPKIRQVLEGEKMPFWQTLLHIFTQILYVGTGGSVGRELAPREFASLLAEKWQTLLARLGFAEIEETDRKLLIASAAGAGFAAAYIAPITGMLFCLEILYKKLNKKSVIISLSMSIIAMLVGAWIKGTNPYYLVSSEDFSFSAFIFVLFFAPVCGLLGAYFRKSFLWAEKNQTQSKQILWQLPAVSLLTGLIAMQFPQIMGNGRGLAQLAFDADKTEMITALLLLALLKGPLTVLTIRSGAAGGTLAPSISIGASLAAILALMIPGFSVGEAAMIGAVAMLASAQQAPLMALFMMIEISHLPLQSVAPLGLAAVLAITSSQFVLKSDKKHKSQ